MLLQVAAIAQMGMGTINKVFVSSKAQPEREGVRQPGAFNLLWSGADPAAADGFLGPQESSAHCRGDAGLRNTSHGQPNSQQTQVSMIDWRKGAYAIRFKGSEFVTSKALAHGGAAVGSGVSAGSRYSGSAGVANVNALPEPVQPAASSDSPPETSSNAHQGAGNDSRQQAQQQVVATMWIAGSEARAMEERILVGPSC
jgi:hypothetical protein